MNPEKAAPSAPVKKAVREDPQILPDGLHPTSGFGTRHGPPKFFGHKNAASYKTMRQIGGPRGIRTLDLSDANRTLSQLSYRPTLMNVCLMT